MSPGGDRAWNPRGSDTRAYKNACDFPLTSGGSPRYLNSLNPHKQQSKIGTQTQLRASEQQIGGQPGEIGMPRTTQGRRHRREVLHPTHSIGTLAIRETWSGEQNLPVWYTVGIKSSCSISPLSVGSIMIANSSRIPRTRSTNTGLSHARQQGNGGNGGLLGEMVCNAPLGVVIHDDRFWPRGDRRLGVDP